MVVRYSQLSPTDTVIYEQLLEIVVPVGAQVINVFQVVGSVRIVNQWARIVEVTLMDNLTAVYATLYDGTTTTELTADGIDLSNLGVGTFFTKEKAVSEPYSLLPGNTSGVLETAVDKNIGRPFTVNQKNGSDTFIQLRATAGGSEQSFKMVLHFEYKPLNGGSSLTPLL